MIEVQARFPEFPGEPWHPMFYNRWQLIKLEDIKRFRYRFNGKVINTRKELIQALEEEIIMLRLQGKVVFSNLQNGTFKKRQKQQ